MMIRYRRYNRALEICFDYHGVPADKWYPTSFSKLIIDSINELKVKYGYGVASYLGYPSSLDNHSVIGLWLQEKLKGTGWLMLTFGELMDQLKIRIPSTYFY